MRSSPKSNLYPKPKTPWSRPLRLYVFTLVRILAGHQKTGWYRRKMGILFFVVLSFVAVLFLRESLFLNPVDDSILALSFGTKPVTSFFSQNFVTLFPSYRPLGQLSIWIQYQIVGLSVIWSYYLVNLLLWVLCCVIAALFIYKYTKAGAVSLLFAALLLTDNRTIAFISWITERQNLLMILFGLISMVRTQKVIEEKKVSVLSIMGIGLLLLGSALSKEYGIAFSMATGATIFLSKQKQIRLLYLAPVLALGAYISLRILVFTPLDDIVSKFCEDMGFFFKQQQVCYYNQSISGKYSQYVYNIIASFFGAFLPALFNEYGKIKELSVIHYPHLYLNLIVTGLFWRARKRWQPLRFLFLLILCSSVLGFMLYRTRNQFVSIAPIYMGAGIGLAFFLKDLKKAKMLTILIVGYFLTWIIHFGFATTIELKRLHAYYDAGWICGTLLTYPRDVSTEIVKKLGLIYHVETEGCIKAAQEKIRNE